MRALLIQLLNFLLILGTIVMMVGAAVLGFSAMSLDGSGAGPIGAILGLIIGTIVAALLFGTVAAILDIREMLQEFREYIRRASPNVAAPQPDKTGATRPLEAKRSSKPEEHKGESKPEVRFPSGGQIR